MADAIGRGNPQRARDLSVRLLKWGIALGGVLAVLYAGLEAYDGDVLVKLFTEDVTIAHKVGEGQLKTGHMPTTDMLTTRVVCPLLLCVSPVVVVAQVTPIVWLVALMQPLNGFVNVGAGVLQGAQDFAYQVRTAGQHGHACVASSE